MKSNNEPSVRLAAMKRARDENLRHLKLIENQLNKHAEQFVIEHRKKARQFGRGKSTWTPPDEQLFQAKFATLKVGRQSEIDASTRKIERQNAAIAAAQPRSVSSRHDVPDYWRTVT